jgi:hypothetical protein
VSDGFVSERMTKCYKFHNRIKTKSIEEILIGGQYMIPFSIGDRCFITHRGENVVFVDQLGCLLQRRNWSRLKWNIFQRVASAGTLHHLVGVLEAKKWRSFKLRAHHGV